MSLAQILQCVMFADALNITTMQIVFATADEDLGQAAQDVVLDKSDLKRIAEQVGTENSNG